MHKNSSVNGPNVRFSADDDEQLIEFVNNHTILYDLKDTEFKNAMKKDLIWEKAGRVLNRPGTECKKRWKSVRDHYRMGKKEGTGTRKAAKKRAIYWDRLRFLDVVEDERDSFSNIFEHGLTTVVDAGTKIVEEGVLTRQTSDQSNLPVLSEPTEMSGCQELSSADFQLPKSKKRNENTSLNKYLKEKKEDRDHFKRCLEDFVAPQPEEDETDMFFKTIAVTVKKFRPDLATKTKAKIFQITTEMELLQSQNIPFISGFTNIIYGDSQNSYPSSAVSSPWTTPYTPTPDSEED